MTQKEKNDKIKEVEELLKIGGVPKHAKNPIANNKEIVTVGADIQQKCEEKSHIEAKNKVSAKPEISKDGGILVVEDETKKENEHSI